MGNCCFKGKDNNDDNHELEEDSSNLRSQDHNNRSSFNNNNNNTLFYSNDKAYTSPALVTLSKLQQQQQQQLQPHDKIELQVKSLNLFLENFQFQLNSYVDLDQNSFQDKWQSFYFSQNFEYPMLKNNKSEVLEQIDFEDFLSKHYIFTLASGKSNGTLKLYLYAQEVCKNCFFFWYKTHIFFFEESRR